MSNKQFTIKSKLISDVSILILLLLNELSNIYFDSSYSSYFSLSWWILGGIIVFCTFKFKGINDELYETILSKINKKSINLMYLSIGLVSVIAATPSTSYIFTSVNTAGLLITWILLFISIFRLFLFIYYDKKGLEN